MEHYVQDVQMFRCILVDYLNESAPNRHQPSIITHSIVVESSSEVWNYAVI